MSWWNNPIPWNSRTEPPYDPDGLSSGAANAASVGGGQPKFAVSAAIGAGQAAAQFGSSLINYYSQRATNRSNERMNRENNEANLRLWQMNNEYNTPVNQRRRMEAAGFNPNLMYGSMSPGNSSAPATSEASYNQAPQLSDFGNAIGNAYQLYQQSQLIDKQIEAQELINQGQDIKNKQESKNLGWMDEIREEEKRAADDLSRQVDSIVSLNGQKVLESAAVINKLAAETKLTDEQVIEARLNNKFLTETLDERIRAIALQNGIAESQIAYYRQMVITMSKQALLYAAQATAQQNINSLWNGQEEYNSYLRGLTMNWKEWYDNYYITHEMLKNKTKKDVYHNMKFLGDCMESVLPLIIQDMSDEAAMRRTLISNRDGNGFSFDIPEQRAPRGIALPSKGSGRGIKYFNGTGTLPRMIGR
nr:MAG TPA: DNA pilot protein VP2 [Microviridae sp.]